jgi:hypothetical protein
MLQNAPKTPLEMRSMLDGFAPFLNAGLPEVGALHEAIPVREGVTADVVVPRGAGPHPVLVYLHGGGWVCGSPKTHQKLGYRFAEAGYLVFNVDYRLAPEHSFPTPFEDCSRPCAGRTARRRASAGIPSGSPSAATARAETSRPPWPRRWPAIRRARRQRCSSTASSTSRCSATSRW